MCSVETKNSSTATTLHIFISGALAVYFDSSSTYIEYLNGGVIEPEINRD